MSAALPRLKVCCIASVEEARLAVDAGASALGLVGAMPSGPGPIDDALIAAIAARVPPPVAAFLLTSETAPDAVVAHVARCRAGVVQLVDAVAPATYEALRRALPAVKIVQVVHVVDEGAVEEACRVAPHVDAVLLDSGRPGLAVKELGGTGRVHDWSVSRRVVEACGRPVFLAGGLRADNVAEAVRAVRPFGLDVCSGVRTDGRLDAAKLRAFVAAVRGEPPR
ncbi:MAG: phosphoribosylanthranilate isomerase [Polyangiales bacterium]